ncbi:PD-(D/E)XK nuclease-like domain-containing protein [Pantoea vagans]|uniref:PD-(D/E)XK nuclease-like domain-containing protein n=1 Tax=Pantoea vagans TaxID=470934 RepID=UPI0028E63617|nr:PD-(D/E)XK nuclease-like domain-containing protein [Pantoea vagans]
MKPGIYHGLSNEAYHAGPGVSKSQLDDIAINPAIYLWRQHAPVDTDKTAALDMGSALHCMLLEPDQFDKRFAVAPIFDRRTTQGKADEQAFLNDARVRGTTVMDAGQGRKLRLMCESVMAHHTARFLLEADGHCESSLYWSDTETDELCRIRPDKFLTGRPVILDVKKVSDMSRFARHIEEFRYHVQAAMYSEGFYRCCGAHPQFVFIAVSESIDCGRYPVRVFDLHDDDMREGFELFRRDLSTFHSCRLSNNWGGVQTIQRPVWAR